MNKFFALIAVAGLSIFAMSDSASADHRCRGNVGYYGGGYYSPGYYGGHPHGFYAPVNRGFYDGGYYGGWRGGYGGRGWNGGYGGFYGPSFGIQTRGFGLYVR